MNKKILIEFINDEKLNTLELIDTLHNKEKYNLSEEQIDTINDQLIYKIEESNNKIELIKIKEKLEKYNMNTDLVDKMIKRQEPIKDKDIRNFDIEEIEYYIYDGYDKLTLKQQYLLLKKAKQMKYNQDDINYLIEQINEKEELNNNCQEEELESSDSIFSLFSLFSKENKKKDLDYESYQFEEEELEEDDYYYEDPD